MLTMKQHSKILLVTLVYFCAAPVPDFELYSQVHLWWKWITKSPIKKKLKNQHIWSKDFSSLCYSKLSNSFIQALRRIIPIHKCKDLLLFCFIIIMLIFVALGKKKSSLKMPANPTFSHTDIQEFSAVIVTIPQVFWIYPSAVISYLLSYLFWIFRKKIIWVGVSLLFSKRMTKALLLKSICACSIIKGHFLPVSSCREHVILS